MHQTINRLIYLITLIFLVGCSSLPVVVDYGLQDYKLSFQQQPVQKFDNDLIAVNGTYPTIVNIVNGTRPVIDLYRQDTTHDAVVSFFTSLTGAESIALAILRHAERSRVPALLSFALSWGESRFDIYAQNGNPNSTDRGLFQLNSLTFYWLEEDDFYDPDINAYYAHNYFSACLRRSKSDYKMAWAMYNAGMVRVLRGEIPQMTQAYVIKLSAFYEKLQRQYKNYILKHYPPQNAVTS